MKLPLSGLQYVAIVAIIYLIVGLTDIWVYRFIEPFMLAMIYCCVLTLPFVVPLQWLVNVTPFWKMKVDK